MAQLPQGQRLTLPITATQGYYFSTSGAAIVRVTPSNGGAFVVTIGTNETDVGWYGFPASLELVAQSGVLTYNTTPSALTAVQLGDQRDSDPVDLALAVNILIATNAAVSDSLYGCENGEDNTVKLQKMINEAAGRRIYITKNNKITTPLLVPSNVEIEFMQSGRIDNIGTGSTLMKSILMVGHWHPSMYGSKPIGSPNPYERKVFRYAVTPTALNSISVTMVTPADAANFVAEEIYFLASNEAISQTSTGVDIELPNLSAIVKVKSVNVGTGVVTFYDAVGFATATNAWLCKLDTSTTDQGVAPYIPQNVRIKNAIGDGHSMFGLTSSCYNLTVDGWAGNHSYILQVNGFVNSSLQRYRGTFLGVALEVKFCARNTTITDVIGNSNQAATAGSIGLIALGEGARNVTIQNFELYAPVYLSTGSIPTVQFLECSDCKVLDGYIFAPTNTSQMIQFYSTNMFAPTENLIADVKMVTASRLGIRFSGDDGTNKPTRSSAIRCKLITSYSLGATMFLARIEGSTDCNVDDCSSPNLTTIEFTSASVRPMARRNLVAPGGGVIGTNGKQIGARENFTIGSGALQLGVGISVTWGTVNPEGSVTADSGSWYYLLSGLNATAYFKTTGAGNTGWVLK